MRQAPIPKKHLPVSENVTIKFQRRQRGRSPSRGAYRARASPKYPHTSPVHRPKSHHSANQGLSIPLQIVLPCARPANLISDKQKQRKFFLPSLHTDVSGPAEYPPW